MNDEEATVYKEETEVEEETEVAEGSIEKQVRVILYASGMGVRFFRLISHNCNRHLWSYQQHRSHHT